MRDIHPKVEEAIETLNMKDGPTRRRLLKGTGLVSATAAASALLTACGSNSAKGSGGSKVGDFPSTPQWKFWFVNHVYTNPFFVPTQYGFADAAALLNLAKPNWGGSASTSSVPEMVSYFNEAVSAKADGIASSVISATGFTTPVSHAMNEGIPVVSYNSDGTYVNDKPDIGTNRLAYVGQSLFLSGQQMGQKIAEVVPGGGDIVIFIATPGTGNIQPRYDGAASVLNPMGKYKLAEIATGAATSAELAAEKAYLEAHKNVKGIFAVDAGSTSFIPQAKAATGLNSVPAGGFDVLPPTIQGINSGALNFSIDQSPYLQGFLPVLYLYLFKLSGGLVHPPNTDTGLTFVTSSNIKPYLQSTRFEGSGTAQKYIQHSGAIQNPMATTST
jgi:simple sugar transport system substrate-binding protein